MIALLLAGCVTHRPPVVLFPEPPDTRELPAPRTAEEHAPGACVGVVIRPGWTADCAGIGISLAHDRLFDKVEADLALARTYLQEAQAGRLADRAYAQREWAEEREARLAAEREARQLRAALPFVGLGGGVVIAGLVYGGLQLGAAVR